MERRGRTWLAIALVAPAAWAQTVTRSWTGEAAGDQFGLSVSDVGDVDGDGVRDVLIGAPMHDGPGGTDAGRVYLYGGGSGELLNLWSGEAPGAVFGWAVSGAGDVDSDGIPDVAIGARLHPGPLGPESGRAYVYSGADGALLALYDAEARLDQLGVSVAAAGDVDGDGVDDVIVGSRFHENLVGPRAGRAYVYSVLDDRLLWSWDGEAQNDRFSVSVAGPGDVDDDGFTDVLVGAPLHNGLDSDTGCRGRAYLYSGRTGQRVWFRDGEMPGDDFGVWVASAGDVDGDGTPDLAVGARLHDGVGNRSGRAYTYAGSDGRALASWSGGAVGEELGRVVDGVGDADGDELDDVLVGANRVDGARGATYVYSGATSELVCSFTGEQPGDELGLAASGIEDLDGDGTLDVLAGAYLHDGPAGVDSGAVYAWECAPLALVAEVDASCLASCPGARVVYSIQGENRTGAEATVTVEMVRPVELSVLDTTVPPGPFALAREYRTTPSFPPVEDCPVTLAFRATVTGADGSELVREFATEAVVPD